MTNRASSTTSVYDHAALVKAGYPAGIKPTAAVGDAAAVWKDLWTKYSRCDRPDWTVFIKSMQELRRAIKSLPGWLIAKDWAETWDDVAAALQAQLSERSLRGMFTIGYTQDADGEYRMVDCWCHEFNGEEAFPYGHCYEFAHAVHWTECRGIPDDYEGRVACDVLDLVNAEWLERTDFYRPACAVPGYSWPQFMEDAGYDIGDEDAYEEAEAAVGSWLNGRGRDSIWKLSPEMAAAIARWCSIGDAPETPSMLGDRTERGELVVAEPGDILAAADAIDSMLAKGRKLPDILQAPEGMTPGQSDILRLLERAPDPYFRAAEPCADCVTPECDGCECEPDEDGIVDGADCECEGRCVHDNMPCDHEHYTFETALDCWMDKYTCGACADIFRCCDPQVDFWSPLELDTNDRGALADQPIRLDERGYRMR